MGGFSAWHDIAEVTYVVSLSQELGWGWNIEDGLSSSMHFLYEAFQCLVVESQASNDIAAGFQKQHSKS